MYFSPTKTNRHVEKVLRLIKAEYEPEQVPVLPETYCEEKSCYYNVPKKIALNGGKIHYGWAILQDTFICEAERHAVWENEDGNLIDITPRPVPFNSIMFVSDNENFTYEGQFIDNVRVNISGDLLVEDFIKLAEIVELLFSKGKRINDMEVSIPEDVVENLKIMDYNKSNIYTFMVSGANFNSRCFCQSGLTYKNCHHNNVIRSIQDIKRLHF